MSDQIDKSRKIEITGGTITASGAGALSLGDISGTVANKLINYLILLNQMNRESKNY